MRQSQSSTFEMIIGVLSTKDIDKLFQSSFNYLTCAKINERHIITHKTYTRNILPNMKNDSI